MIYLDAAATTLQKPSAVARASGYAMGHMASPGRGGHPPAMLAADTVFACRERAAELFHVREPDDVVFTMTASSATMSPMFSVMCCRWLKLPISAPGEESPSS